jgi:rfaE bifunctional protein nucleotidyltransferase chain/domain
LERVAVDVPVVWDPHPRGAAPVAGCAAVTPNLSEARTFAGTAAAHGPAAGRVATAAALAGPLQNSWRSRSVVVTLGGDGALLAYGDGAPLVARPDVSGAGGAEPDTCGAGDRFAGELSSALADGRLLGEAVPRAVAAASAFVHDGAASSIMRGAPGGTPALSEPPPATPGASALDEVLSRVRAAGGAVVATGGVFDLLHAGHVRYLRRARSLGDALVVLVNDDASVTRLKGPHRPLQPLADRAAVLAALGCVDAVVPFGEDTPVAALDRIRPDLWVKGGDYAGADMPEAAALASWGGHVVVVPYLDGRSTTGLIHRAVTRASSRPPNPARIPEGAS